MPVVHLHFMEGRTPDQKRKLVKMITDAVVQSLNVEPAKVYIYMHEVSKANFSRAGAYAFDGALPKVVLEEK